MKYKSVRISEDLYNEVKKFAKESNRSIKDIVDSAVRKYLSESCSGIPKDSEDRADNANAEATLYNLVKTLVENDDLSGIKISLLQIAREVDLIWKVLNRLRWEYERYHNYRLP